VLLSLSAVATTLAAVLAATGGFDVQVAGITIRSHAVTRPVIVALVLGAAGIALSGVDGTRGVFDRIAARLRRYGLSIAVVFAAAIGIGLFYGGAQIGGGADSSGYLSEARLWRAANFTNLQALKIATPLASELTLSNGQYPFTPVGYQPSGTAGFAVPGYPPGLPLHFAVASAIAGERAQFVVVPLCAAGIVILSFLLGRKLAGEDAALIAAACGGASPMMLYQATQPMSDVVAAFWWTLAVLLLLTPAYAASAAAGVAAAIACSVRPNLFAVVPIIVLLAAWWQQLNTRTILRLLVFAAPVAIAAGGFAYLQRTMYGNASTTGYGTLGTLFGLQYVWPNLLRYPKWAYYTQSALIAAAFAAPIVIRRGLVDPILDRATAERVAWSGLIFFVGLQGFYLLYLSFDDWVYFRFLLPALPWVLVLQAAVLTAACRRVPAPASGIALLLVAVLAASWGVGRARAIGAFRLQDSEQRYLDVAGFARRQPPNAVFISLQHSGSLAYNAGSHVLRWDWVEPGEIDRAVSELEANGHPLFAVLDDWEELQFRERFAATRTVTRLRALFTAGGPPAITVHVYSLTAPTAAAGAAAFSWPPLPALRVPRMPGARPRGFDPATSFR
jgi:hypothetical protein